MQEQQQQPSGLYHAASSLGAALGIAAAIFATPLVFGWGKAAVTAYLRAQAGSDFAEPLLYAVGVIEAYVIFGVCRMVITFAMVWAMTTLAARGLGNS